jgi:hypothetical protein
LHYRRHKQDYIARTKRNKQRKRMETVGKIAHLSSLITYVLDCLLMGDEPQFSQADRDFLSTIATLRNEEDGCSIRFKDASGFVYDVLVLETEDLPE